MIEFFQSVDDGGLQDKGGVKTHDKRRERGPREGGGKRGGGRKEEPASTW